VVGLLKEKGNGRIEGLRKKVKGRKLYMRSL